MISRRGLRSSGFGFVYSHRMRSMWAAMPRAGIAAQSKTPHRGFAKRGSAIEGPTYVRQAYASAVEARDAAWEALAGLAERKSA